MKDAERQVIEALVMYVIKILRCSLFCIMIS